MVKKVPQKEKNVAKGPSNSEKKPHIRRKNVVKRPPHRRKSSRKAFKRQKKDPHMEANVAKKPLHEKKEQKRPLNCEKNLPIRGKRSQNCHHMEKRVAKRLSTMKNPPPHGEINVATRPPFYFTIFILQQMLYISWIFVLASHSTNIFILFTPHRTLWPIFAFPFFIF